MKIRELILLGLFSTLVTSLAGQSTNNTMRFMAFAQNEHWLTTIKSLDKSRQWAELERRFFSINSSNASHDSIQYSPLMVVNGIPLLIPDTLTRTYSESVSGLLNESTIQDINVVDKLTEQWTFCKPFSGVIILTVDEKVAKKLSKLK